MFTHLHVHSQFSILDGMSKIPELVSTAASYGMTALALTDHGNMYGIKEFTNEVNKYNGGPAKKLKEAQEELSKTDDPAKKAELEEKIAKLKDIWVWRPIAHAVLYMTRTLTIRFMTIKKTAM